jgi:hypothetical protein
VHPLPVCDIGACPVNSDRALIRALKMESHAWQLMGARCDDNSFAQQFAYWTAYSQNCLADAFARELDPDKQAASLPGDTVID